MMVFAMWFLSQADDSRQFVFCPTVAVSQMRAAIMQTVSQAKVWGVKRGPKPLEGLDCQTHMLVNGHAIIATTVSGLHAGRQTPNKPELQCRQPWAPFQTISSKDNCKAGNSTICYLQKEQAPAAWHPSSYLRCHLSHWSQRVPNLGTRGDTCNLTVSKWLARISTNREETFEETIKETFEETFDKPM